MSTSDNWDTGFGNINYEDNQIENVGYYAVFNGDGKRLGGKSCKESEAIKNFVEKMGNQVFGWEDFKNKGFAVNYVDVKRIKEDIRKLEIQLKEFKYLLT